LFWSRDEISEGLFDEFLRVFILINLSRLFLDQCHGYCCDDDELISLHYPKHCSSVIQNFLKLQQQQQQLHPTTTVMEFKMFSNSLAPTFF
jgi:hypothetical protein